MKRITQAGQAPLLATFGLVVLISAMGLGIDIGFLRYQRRLQQSAADSAAIAGASEINFGDVAAAAQVDSASNGFTNSSTQSSKVGNVTVTVYNPPNDGPHKGLAGYVEVLVSEIQLMFFMRIAGIKSATVTTRAVAYIGGGTLSGCLYALGIGNSSEISNKGSGGITAAPTCEIFDNGNLLNDGTGSITAGAIGVAGSVTNNGNGQITPTPVTGIVPAADPLASVQPPTAGSCLPNGTGQADGSTPVTLSPGNYCQGIAINGSQNVTLNPGTYSVTSGGISFNGTGTISGTGVTLYIGPSGGGVTLSGSQTVTLIAPTTGTDPGILFYQDRSNSSAATINGSQSSTFQGALYFPAAALTIKGTGSNAVYTIAVASSLSLHGNSMLNFPADYSSLGSSPVKNVVLVE